MSVLITSITELSQKFFNSDPLEFDEYFAITPDYQKYCLGANLFSRFTVAAAKEAMLIHDIAIHLLAGGCKLATGGVKGVCGIASGIFGLEPDHQTPSKQAVVHLGFVSLYVIDILASITNINNTYPQHLVDKIKNIFVKFLETPNKEATIQYIADPETEEELKATREELEQRNADFNQLEEEIERTTKDLESPSQCEQIIDEALKPNTKASLERIRNSTGNNQVQKPESEHPMVKEEYANWFEDDSRIYEMIDSLTQNNKNTRPSSTAQGYLLMDDDDLLEETWIDQDPSIIDPSLVATNKPENLNKTNTVSQNSQALQKFIKTKAILPTTNQSARSRGLEYSEKIKRRKHQKK